MNQIKIKYAIGYGTTSDGTPRPDEKVLTVDLEDLNLQRNHLYGDDDALHDAIWCAVLDDIRRNASLIDVLDNLSGVTRDVRKALEAVHGKASMPTSPRVSAAVARNLKLTPADAQILRRKNAAAKPRAKR